jgi:hypothetical protein
MPISRGCSRCVECGGNIPIIMPSRSASSIKAMFTWLECPSTSKSLLERPACCLVAESKTFLNQLRPNKLQLYPLSDAVKKTKSLPISSNQELCKS